MSVNVTAVSLEDLKSMPGASKLPDEALLKLLSLKCEPVKLVTHCVMSIGYAYRKGKDVESWLAFSLRAACTASVMSNALIQPESENIEIETIGRAVAVGAEMILKKHYEGSYDDSRITDSELNGMYRGMLRKYRSGRLLDTYVNKHGLVLDKSNVAEILTKALPEISYAIEDLHMSDSGPGEMMDFMESASYVLGEMGAEFLKTQFENRFRLNNEFVGPSNTLNTESYSECLYDECYDCAKDIMTEIDDQHFKQLCVESMTNCVYALASMLNALVIEMRGLNKISNLMMQEEESRLSFLKVIEGNYVMTDMSSHLNTIMSSVCAALDDENGMFGRLIGKIITAAVTWPFRKPKHADASISNYDCDYLKERLIDLAASARKISDSHKESVKGKCDDKNCKACHGDEDEINSEIKKENVE